MTTEAQEQAKTARVRKINVTPSVNGSSMSLAVDVLANGTHEMTVDVSELSQETLLRLALKGITAFIHDKTAGVKDVDTIPALVGKVFEAVKSETVFSTTRERSDVVSLPKFVEAILVRDGLDRTDNSVRQQALASWTGLSNDEKSAVRKDSTLANIVKMLNSMEASKELEAAGIVI